MTPSTIARVFGLALDPCCPPACCDADAVFGNQVVVCGNLLPFFQETNDDVLSRAL